MVICEDCGDVLDESELKQERSYISDYMGGCYETYSVCPCGGEVVDAKRCEICDDGRKVERLITIAHNAMAMLEDITNESIMGTDMEDEIGITQEEYDDIM